MSLASKQQKKKGKKDQEEEVAYPTHNSLLDTARSGFATTIDPKYHMHSIHGKDSKGDPKDQNASFIAQSEMIVAKGVTVRLHDGTELKHVPGTTDEHC